MSMVMTFGNGLGGRGEDAYEPTPIPSLPSDIVSIHAGHYHSLAVTSQGQLWAWGYNEDAQLGRGLSNRKSCNEPKRVEGLENVKVCTAFASRTVSGVVGDDGSVWVWGMAEHGQLGIGNFLKEAIIPTRVEALSEEKVTKVSFGREHALACTVDGKLFRWGCSNYKAIGKLGKFWEPRLVQELHGIQVLDIACGNHHSLILCCNGTLLSCGFNGQGQLGRDGKESKFLPVEMSFKLVSIATGPYHSLAICHLDESNGANVGTTKIASWGMNRHFELGRTGSNLLPGLIDGIDGENLVSVSVGCAHSVALTSKEKLWVWGSGLDGKLGFQSPAKQCEPHYLDSLEGFQILQVVCGFEHTLVLVAS